MSWNPVLNLIVEIKHKYESKCTDGALNLEMWIEKVNEDKYNEFFDCLEIEKYKNFALIRYGLQEMQEGMWEDENSPYRECRSVVVDLENEELVLTPFRKFFNLNEVKENKEDVVREKIRNAEVFEITDKLDGSMQSFRWYRNSIFKSGSRSMNTEESWRLADGYSMLTENHKTLFKDYYNYTFTFEYISIRDAHVVSYDTSQEGLYLIGVRDVRDGQMMTYQQLIDLAEAYEIGVVKQESLTLDEMLEKMKTFKSDEKEGWILNIDGQYIKLKCDDYVSIHRILDKVSSVNVVIEHIAEGSYDDLISKVPDTYKPRVQEISNKVFNYLKYTRKQIEEYYTKAPKNDRKEFMIWCEQNVPKSILAYVRNEYLGKEYNLLKKQKDGYKRMSEIQIGE